MSKSKPKDKKPQNYELLQKQFEDQKRDLIDATFTIKKLQERVNLLTHENHRLQQQRQNQFNILNEKIEQLSIKNETNQKRLITMRNDLTNSQVENKKLSNTIGLLQRNMNDERAQKNKEFQEMKKNLTFEIAKYENMLNDYKLYMSERDSRQRQINQLIQAREIQIANRIRDVADKEREKVQATDKIREEMGNKIRQMRQNLLSLKKEELETTTRLTMLQNHQLTSQLEYQSKQTQKIVFKNEELEKTIAKLRQQLDIHKQVEDQLAKRSHFSKGIIKKLHARVQELEGQLNKSKQETYSYSGQNSMISKKQSIEKPEKAMTQVIDKQLQKAQKRYAELQSRYEVLQREKQQISLKWQTSQRIKNELYNSLLHCFTNLTTENQKENENNTISLDLNLIKKKNPKYWTNEQLNGVLQILLVSCQSYLSKSNLNTPALRKIVLLSEQKQSKQSLPRLASDRQKKLFVNLELRCLQFSQEGSFKREVFLKNCYQNGLKQTQIVGQTSNKQEQRIYQQKISAKQQLSYLIVSGFLNKSKSQLIVSQMTSLIFVLDMQTDNVKNVVQHGYFAIGGFDMNGGDLQIHPGFASYEEAIIVIKNKIHQNENLCGMIQKNMDNTIFIKRKTNTNPSANKSECWKCTNIFYGRRITSKSNISKKSNSSQEFDYYIVDGLDMWGGDLFLKQHIVSFEEALEQAKQLINFDGSRCAQIIYWGQNSYSVHLKYPKETNPIKSADCHWRSTIVFLGRTV